MRNLTVEEITIVAGGNGTEGGSNSGGSGNLADHPCNPGTGNLADSTLNGAIAGAMGGAPGGLVGAAAGALAGAVVGAVGAAISDSSDIETCMADQESK